MSSSIHHMIANAISPESPMKIPAGFQRVAAAFDEVARVRSCDSSGSEHSVDDLSDLVNSFLEREIREERKNSDDVNDHRNPFDDDDEDDDGNLGVEDRDSLEKLFDRQNDAVKSEIEKACEEIVSSSGSGSSSPEFKRRLMCGLRSRGFDAGLCKSRWERKGRLPPGEYEYVDVNAGGSRYVVEVFLAGEFTIARPRGGYGTLLEVFPQIYVGKCDELKQVVRVMCSAIRRSMKSGGIHVPPWRRLSYMQSRWFGSYRRTTNEIASVKKASNLIDGVPKKGIFFYCRQELGAGAGGRVGNLTAAFKHKEMML